MFSRFTHRPTTVSQQYQANISSSPCLPNDPSPIHPADHQCRRPKKLNRLTQPLASILLFPADSHVITPLMITIRLWGPSQGGQDWLTQMPGLAIGGDCAQPTIDCRLHHLITRIIIRPRARSQQLRNIAGSCNIC